MIIRGERMNTIIITVFFEKYGNKSYRKGEFKVNSRLYAEYPDLEAAKVASKWIWELERESGFAMKVLKVLHEDKDITNLISYQEPKDPPGKETELPF